MQWLGALTVAVAQEQVSRKLAAEVRKLIGAFLQAYKGHVTDDLLEQIQTELEELRQRVEGRDEPWRRGSLGGRDESDFYPGSRRERT